MSNNTGANLRFEDKLWMTAVQRFKKKLSGLKFQKMKPFRHTNGISFTAS